MKVIVLVLISLFSFQLQADQLKDFCSAKKGTLLKKYRCPKSGLNLPIRTCEYRNEFGDLQFVNGCSGPSGGHGELFFKACIVHDLCYHHEPSTNGYERKDCDQIFLKTALESCHHSSDQKSCHRWAKLMYNSLRVVGGPAYHCADYTANY